MNTTQNKAETLLTNAYHSIYEMNKILISGMNSKRNLLRLNKEELKQLESQISNFMTCIILAKQEITPPEHTVEEDLSNLLDF